MTVIKEEPQISFEHQPRLQGVAICAVSGFADGMPLLTSNAFEGVIPAERLLCAPETFEEVGSEVAVMFENGVVRCPIVIGPVLRAAEQDTGGMKSIRLEAEHEIELTCGKTTIKMSDDGTVAIRGVNVATRAAHTNRIRGGNVQIN